MSTPSATALEPSGTRLRRALRTELGSLHPRLLLVDLPVRLLPHLAFPYLRTALYRLAGISIGAHSLLAGRLELIGPGAIERRLKIGEHCWFNAPFFADLTGDITIGDRVTIGHHVVLVTATHQHGEFSRRAGPSASAPSAIGDGSWIGAGVTILPGVTIGAGSIIGAGSVVTRDVPPDTVALGTPARAVRRLGGGPSQDDSRAHSSHERLSTPSPPDGKVRVTR